MPLPTYSEINFSKKPKNIILMIGDGMSISQISAALFTTKDLFYLEKFPVVGLHKSYSASDLVTDSAAGATAFSSGVKTYNNAIGVDVDTVPLKLITEIAHEKGWATGLVTTTTIVHATPASFAAHESNRVYYENIAEDLAVSEVDLMIGGGQKYFDRRNKDDRNLLREMRGRGYRTESYFYNDLDIIPIGEKDKLLYLTADDSPLGVQEGRDYLPFATKFATVFLDSRSTKGFFLMVEGGQIDWAGHSNSGSRVVAEVLDFNKAIESALRFAAKDKETLVIVTADHETGGLALNGDNKGRRPKLKFTTNGHTAQLTTVFAYGPQAELFRGVYENTAIFDKMIQAFGWNEK